jgi:hypothetical protein
LELSNGAREDNVRNGRHRQRSGKITTDTHTQMETSKQKEGVNKGRMKNIEWSETNK